jgi:SAM-dependent methyltransferase
MRPAAAANPVQPTQILTKRLEETEEEGAFYDAEIYDLNLENGPRLGRFYASWLAAFGGSIVEFGCGTGDILLRLAAQGKHLLGVEPSAGMLAVCRSKFATLPADVPRPELRQGDLMSDPGESRYDLGIMPNDLVGHLLNRDDLVRSLANAGRFLKPGGRLLADQPRFDAGFLGPLCNLEGAVQREGRYVELPDGRSVQSWVQGRYDRWSGILTTKFRFDWMDRKGRVTDSFYKILKMKPWRTDEIVLAMRVAGFQKVEVAQLDPQVRHPRDMIEGSEFRG